LVSIASSLSSTLLGAALRSGALMPAPVGPSVTTFALGADTGAGAGKVEARDGTGLLGAMDGREAAVLLGGGPDVLAMLAVAEGPARAGEGSESIPERAAKPSLPVCRM
jgi:hypothetical protein